jgi:hypothetical protein
MGVYKQFASTSHVAPIGRKIEIKWETICFSNITKVGEAKCGHRLSRSLSMLAIANEVREL